MTHSVSKGLADSEYVRIADGVHVFDIQLPDGTSIGLTTRQAVAAVVEDHGNAGRSRIRFTIDVEVQAKGSKEANVQAIAIGLLRRIETLEKEAK